MPPPRIALQPARRYSKLDHAGHGLIVLPAADDVPADLPQREARRNERFRSGAGAAASDLTGFGVARGLTMFKLWLCQE
jgi:hypothetical protein